MALLGLNAWWLVRDLRPVPELKTVALWMGQERFEEAEKALRELLRRSPHDAQVMIMLARVRKARGDSLGAARFLHAVPFWWPGKAEVQLREGQIDLSLDRPREAEAAWTQSIRDDPLHPVSSHLQAYSQAALALLKLYVLERRKAEARELTWRLYDRATAADREDLLRIRMETELLQESPASIAQTLRRYLAADPEDWQARRALAVVENLLGNRDEALRLIELCLKARPDDLLVRRDLLKILQEQGNVERMAREVAQLPASADRSGEIWKYRGIAREQAGDLQGAADAFRRAIALGEVDTENYYRLGMVERRLGLHEQAAKDIAHSQRLSKALLALSTSFWDYLQAVKTDTGGSSARTMAMARLAADCAAREWTREAEAWESLVPRS